jgi:hypothetical protein
MMANMPFFADLGAGGDFNIQVNLGTVSLASSKILGNIQIRGKKCVNRLNPNSSNALPTK